MPIGHLYVLFRKMPIQVVCSSFNQIVSLILRCMNCVHILDINPGPVISFANILSYSFLRLPFCFVSGFLCCVKAFKLNWVPVVYVCLCFLCLRRQIQKTPLLQFMSKSVLSIFSSEILWLYILHLDL